MELKACHSVNKMHKIGYLEYQNFKSPFRTASKLIKCRPKNPVFNCFLSTESEGVRDTSLGRLFHNSGAVTKKSLSHIHAKQASLVDGAVRRTSPCALSTQAGI